MQQTSLSPAVRLPDPHHRRAKAWAALHGVSLRQALCLAIDALLRGPSHRDVVELPARMIVDGKEVGS